MEISFKKGDIERLSNYYQKIRKGAHFLRERGLTLTALKTARFRGLKKKNIDTNCPNSESLFRKQHTMFLRNVITEFVLYLSPTMSRK